MNRSLAVAALVALALLILPPPGHAIDLVGTRVAEFRWEPASGSVAGYAVYVSRNGAPFPSEPDQTVLRGTSTTVTGRYGESIAIRVSAFDESGQESALSPVSQRITFVPDGSAARPTLSLALYTDAHGRWSVETLAGERRNLRYGYPGTIPVLGDWDGDGTDELGVYEPTRGRWHLRGQGRGPHFHYGFPGTLPVAGDWDGDGIDEVGLYHPLTNEWYLRGEGPGPHFSYGFEGTLPVTGDWDGDGIDEPGVYHPRTGRWYLRGQGTGPQFRYGFPGTLPAVGDWDGDGMDDAAVYNPHTGDWYLRGQGVGPHVHHQVPGAAYPLAGRLAHH